MVVDIIREYLVPLNNVASFFTVLFCFTLTGQNRRGDEPYAFPIALCWAALGVLVTVNAMARNVPEIRPYLPITIIMSRFVLVAVLGLMSIRLHKLYDNTNQPEGKANGQS